jgi:nucleoside-diphosphate-sugar epimerase
VVHLGNHIDFDPRDPQMIFGENMRMNVNVLQAAVDQGARKLLFASSIQVIASVPRLPDGHPIDQPAYLPLDGDSPAFATNPYALSKQAGEVMLEYYTRVYGVDTIAVRWPWMQVTEDRLRHVVGWEKTMPQLPVLAFSYLSFDDAAELVGAIVRATMPGNRIYLPASQHNMLQRPAAEVIREYFPTVPLRKPIDQIESLIDISRITRETGWSPRE